MQRAREVGGSPFDFDPRRWPRDGTLATRVPRKSPRLGGWSAPDFFDRFAVYLGPISFPVTFLSSV